MATIQEISPAPWRLALLPASFNAVPYHVEQQARTSGRRIVMHEYPKRDSPFAEDMGRRAVRYQVTGYLIGPRYNTIKMRLVAVLENAKGGLLIDPYLPMPMMAVCENYSVTETRERGGYCTFEMTFNEAGTPGFSQTGTNTATNVKSTATTASNAVATNADAAATEAVPGEKGIGSA